MRTTGRARVTDGNETEHLRAQQSEVLSRNSERLAAFREGRISVPVVVSGSHSGGYWSQVHSGDTPAKGSAPSEEAHEQVEEP